MADEEDVSGESWTPPELTEQEKLKLELQKLNKSSLDKPVESQTPPITIDQNAPQLNQPNYDVKPDVKIRELSTESRRGKTFSPAVEKSIDMAAKMYGIDPATLRGFAQVESGGDPEANRNKATQYKGVFQIGTRGKDSEWNKYGGGRDPYDPEANADVAAQIMVRNKAFFNKLIGRDPTPAEYYLMHQQGPGFFSKGTMTNIAGNLPKDARTAENMTHEGFKNWWEKRLQRAMAERGSAPTMRKADIDLPGGYLYPGPMADAGKGVIQGGTADTPEAQAMVAELMRGTPIEKVGGGERAAQEVASVARRDPRYRETRKLQGVPTSREQQQVPGELPSVSHTEPTLPIPGITSDGTRALIDASNPSMLSTIMNYQEQNPAPPPPPQPEMRATEPTFMDKLKGVISSLAPQGREAGEAQRYEIIKELLNKPTTPETSVADTLRAISKFDQDITKGGVAGIASIPGQLYSGIVGPAATGVGQLSGSPGLTKFGVETTMGGQTGADAWKKEYGVDPSNPTQMGAAKLGENLGRGPGSTLMNLGMSKVGEQYLGPAAEYMGKNYPIPNINPIGEAQAATVFGKPPLVINTPSGPLAMNDADISQFAYGGLFAIGFGSSLPAVAKTVRYTRSFKPAGLDGVFDPRRPVPGAPGTEAASLPVDKLKAGVIDQGKAMIDIAERQAKYEKGVQHGIDPVAANEVLQAWRVQTNSGAQNLIRNAIQDGEMNVPDYRFNVNVSIGKLVEFAKGSPNFPEYLRLRAIQDELRFNRTSNNSLPLSSKAKPLPTHFDDPSVQGLSHTEGSVGMALTQLEHDHPEYAKNYTHYRDNLDATRDFISSNPNYAVENYQSLTDHAVNHPTLPIFSKRASADALFKDILSGKNPLEVAENNMRRAFEKQMKSDAEKRYIEMTQQNVGSKAFTPRTEEWVNGTIGSRAKSAGAVLIRKFDGESTYWTADPLLVSIMNSGHIPLSGMESTFATAKTMFQKTTTGFFAPWFAPTGMLRSMEQGWTTAPGGVKTAGGRTVLPAGPGSTTMGFLTSVGAKMSRPTAEFFKGTIANSALGKTLTLGQADLLARSFEKWYMDSFYKRMKDAGAYSGDSVMEGKEVYKSIAQARQTYGASPHMNPVINFMQHAVNTWNKFVFDPAKAVLYTPLNEGLTALQEAPAFGWARKVAKGSDETHRPTIRGRELSDAELAAHYRNYTGDPGTRGYIYQKNGQKLRFEPGEELPNRPLNPIQRGAQHALRATWKAQDKAAELAGVGAHWGRSVTPWAGVLFQSPSATLAAMRDNPVRANLAFSASHVMPEMAAYLWNSYWSNQLTDVVDENGQPIVGADGRQIKMKYDYVNHMINGRNDYNLLNNTYFAVPGKKPNEGVEFRHYQEGVLNRYMTRMFMHQYYGKAYGTMGEDVLQGLQGFMNSAVIPPLPSPVGAYLGSKGYVSTGGWVGGLFKSRNNPYVDLGGGENTWELAWRAVHPSVADITIQAAQAGMNSPDWASTPGNVVKQVGKRILGRTAIIGDLTGNKPDTTGTTNLSDELWSNKKTIDDLMYRFRVWDEGKGIIKTNKGSKTGRAYISDYMDELPPGTGKDFIANPGLQQAPPKNPLYNMLMDELVQTFGKDEPKKGGMGFKSMWGHYKIYGDEVSRMRTVNEGNSGKWVQQQLDNPDLMQWLRERNVNPLDYKDVRNFFQTRRNKATQKILQTIKATEQRISEMPNVQELLKGKPFKVNMLDPDEPGLNKERVEEQMMSDPQ